MSALAKLQDKIEAWNKEYQLLKKENIALKKELEEGSSSDKEYLSQIETFKREVKEKDDEIEKIIKQVETLLA